MSELNEKQKRFVEEYLVDLNATQAAIRAGYSPKTAGSQGHDLLKKPEIAAAIQEGRQKLGEKVGITAERVLEEVTRLALSDLRNVMRWGATVAVPVQNGEDRDENGDPVRVMTDIALIPSDELSDFAAASIAEVKQTKEGLAIKLHDKGSALDKLMKHLGLFKAEKLEVAGKDGGPIETKDLTETDIARRIAFVLAKGARAAKKEDSSNGK